ncbi:hypothetical protein ACW73L_06750 [Methylolobus aquaticus]
MSVLVSSGAAAGGEWEPSTLSDKTMQATQDAKVAYDRCLGEQLQASISSEADSRAVADGILRACEDRLAPIRTALVGEKVPDGIIDRYMRQQRSRAAQAVLREVMGAQAMRQATQDAAKQP